MAEEACRIDVWLWRARFSKSRALAARLAEAGRIRLARNGVQTRLDKASRTVRPGDELVFAIAGRLTAVRVVSLGERRGPASEARDLYVPLSAPDDGPAANGE
jgi:ribosome-associated heat shock protein Hsp15